MPQRRDALPRSRRLSSPQAPLPCGGRLFSPVGFRPLGGPRPPATALLAPLIAALLALPLLASRWSLAAESLAQAGGLATPPAPLLPTPAAAAPPAPAATPAPVAAPQATGDGMVTIESDSQRADNRTGIVTAIGNVRIVYPARGLVATARQAQYFSREARLVLSGQVTVIDGEGQRIQAERLVYQLDSERIQAQPATGRQVVTRLRLQAPPGEAPRPPLP